MKESIWEKMHSNFTIEEALKIIDDALCHGFIFKVENHEIYFKETTCYLNESMLF